MSHFALAVNTAPAAEPISTADAKLHLRVDVSDDDDYIDALVSAARKRLEQEAGVALITQTLEMHLDAFPADGGAITVLRPPLQDVSSITYIDSNGDEQTWSSDDYRVDTKSWPGRITPAYNEVYPTTREITGAVTITFLAGYGAAGSAVPQDLIHALKMLIGHWYENREDVITGTITSKVPKAFDWLIAPYKVYRI